jgi:hypothetical protein
MAGLTRTLALGAALTLAPAAAAVAQDSAPDPLPREVGTALQPGRYVSDVVGPTIDFRVGEGWLVGLAGAGPIFTLERADPPGGVLSVTRFDGEAFVDSCDPTSMTLVEPGVMRLVEILAGNPYLNPAPPDVLEVDGFRGLSLDLGVPAYTECPRPFVLLWALPIEGGGEFVQVANQQSRFVVLDVDGDVIVVAIETFPGVPFGRFLDESMALLETMRISPGQYLPQEPDPTPEPAADASLPPAGRAGTDD